MDSADVPVSPATWHQPCPLLKGSCKLLTAVPCTFPKGQEAQGAHQYFRFQMYITLHPAFDHNGIPTSLTAAEYTMWALLRCVWQGAGPCLQRTLQSLSEEAAHSAAPPLTSLQGTMSPVSRRSVQEGAWCKQPEPCRQTLVPPQTRK